jgi:hypothetical protein
VTTIGTAALYGSLLVLSILVVVEAVVILGVLRHVVRIKQEVIAVRASQRRADHLPKGKFVDFSARDLTCRRTTRSADLRGAASALLFVKASHRTHELPDWLMDTFAGLRGKGHQSLFVMCDGELADCAALAELTGEEIRVLHDDGGEIRQRFRVASTPAAVLLDGRARIERYGSMDRSAQPGGGDTS